MAQPEGFVEYGKENLVCQLRKSLYGLKQSPRQWYKRFDYFMLKINFRRCLYDCCVYYHVFQDGMIILLLLYVDDMLIACQDKSRIQDLKKMKSLDDLKHFLGIEVARSKHGIFLSQRKYVLDLLAEIGTLDCKPIDTPSEQNHKLGLYPNQAPTDKERYQRLVGKLIYLAHTRPDIAYAVSVVSQFMHSPSEDHMGAVTRILRYLKEALGKGLMFSKYGHTDVEGYTDADWAGSTTNRRSTFGYFMFVGGNLVMWRSKKQKVVSRSSAEAEYRGMAHGVSELL
ncbi:hypothetical protein ACE6H2_022958 [Prunus campanulata]